MAAANTDKFRKVARRWVGQIGAGGVADDSVTTIPLASATNLPTDTAVTVVIDRVDSNGTSTASLEETIVGVVSGSNLVNCLRGVEGTAQAHSAGAVAEVLITSDGINDIIDGILVQHNQDGTHKKTTITQTTTTGNALLVTRNLAAASTDSAVAQFTQDNSGDDQRAVSIQDDGTGGALFVDQNGAASAFTIDYGGGGSVNVINWQFGANDSLLIDQLGRLTADAGCVTTAGYTFGSTTVTSGEVVKITAPAGLTGKALLVENAGTGYGILVDQNGNGVAIEIDSEVADAGYLLHASTAAQAHAFAWTREDSITNGCAIIIAGSFLWFDATGDLRCKTSRPTSDTDGTVVGTQS